MRGAVPGWAACADPQLSSALRSRHTSAAVLQAAPRKAASPALDARTAAGRPGIEGLHRGAEVGGTDEPGAARSEHAAELAAHPAPLLPGH